MSVSLSPLFNGYQSFLASGLPNAGGFIYTYAAGSTTPQATYTTNSGGIANANPIPLSADGRPPQEIWLTDGQAYKFVVTDALLATLPSSTFDNITGFVSAAITGPNGASVIGTVAIGTGAVTRTVAAKLQDIISVKDFGAVGDGLADDSAAIQLAINALAASGTLVFPFGIYKANTLHFTKSIILDLQGSTMLSTAYASGMSRKVFYCTTADVVGFVTIKNGKLNGAGSNRGTTAAEMEPLVQLDTVGTVVLQDLEVFNHAAGTQSIPIAIKDRLIACLVVRYPSRATFRNITLHDNWNEQMWTHNAQNSDAYTEYLDCKSYNGVVNPANSPIDHTGGRVRISGCHFRDTNASVINLQQTKSAVVTSNTILNNSGDGYGVNCGQDGLTGYTSNVIIDSNYFEGTFRGAISVMGSRIKITNNVIVNPGEFGIKARAAYNATSVGNLLPDYSAPAHQDLFDIVIDGNSIVDVAYTTSITGTAIHLENTDAGYSWKSAVIKNNNIFQPGLNLSKILKYGIVLSSVRNCYVENNDINDATISSISVQGVLTFAEFNYNKFTATTYNSQTDSTISFYSPGNLFSNITFRGNVFRSFSNPGRFDIDFSSGIADTISILNNKGLLSGVNISGINAAYVKDDYAPVTAIPTIGTYNRYDVVKSLPVATGYEGYVVIDKRGTLGTLNAGGTTGSITINQNTLTLNNAAGLLVGQVISVAGAITNAIVININGLVATLSANATATVAAAAVGYVNPTFKGIGSVAA